jgi:hypothetical protein
MRVSNGLRRAAGGGAAASSGSISWAASLPVLLLLAGGCQGVKPIQSHRLIEHQALIDFSGLKPAETVSDLKVNAAIPQAWETMPLQKGTLYNFGQWRSPSTRTGVGAAYIRLPLPIGAGGVLWLAKHKYAEQASDGKLIAEWTDELGRNWFEVENSKYHVRGYALAEGFEAWIVYFGYKLSYPPDLGEISLAARAADTFVPLTGNAAEPVTKPATTQPSTKPVSSHPAGKPAR